MVTAVVYFDTTDPSGFADALGGTGHLFHEVDGFHGFDLMRGVEDPNRFLLIARWDSVDHHRAWQKAHVTDFLEVLDPHMSGPPDIKHFA